MTRRHLIFVSLGLFLLAGCPAPIDPDFQPPDGEVSFIDEFDQTALGGGWEVENATATNVDLAARAGFLRILVDPSETDSPQTRYSVILREAVGDFVLTAAMEFNPQADRHIAGLVIQGEDGRRLAFGLLSASGSRGSFRGIVPVVDDPKTLDLDQTVLAYEESAVVLRIERNRDVFELAYSRDGTTFTRIGTVTTNLSDAVRVGVGAATSADCIANCAEIAAADFDFFEIANVTP